MATPSRLTWRGQPLVPEWPAITSVWTAIPSSSALRRIRCSIQRVQLGAHADDGPLPRGKVFFLGGIRAVPVGHVHRRAQVWDHPIGRGHCPRCCPPPRTRCPARTGPHPASGPSAAPGPPAGAAKQARSSGDLPQISSCPRGKQPPREDRRGAPPAPGAPPPPGSAPHPGRAPGWGWTCPCPPGSGHGGQTGHHPSQGGIGEDSELPVGEHPGVPLRPGGQISDTLLHGR